MLLRHVAEFGLIERAVRRRHFVDEQLSFEVVAFVLNAAPEHIRAVMQFLLRTGLVRVADPDLVFARHVAPDIRNGEAAFFVTNVHGVRFRSPFGVEHDVRSGFFLIGLRRIDDDQADVLADLGSGETAAARVIHRLEHVLREGGEFRRYGGNRLRFLAENGFPVNLDVKQGHYFAFSSVLVSPLSSSTRRIALRSKSSFVSLPVRTVTRVSSMFATIPMMPAEVSTLSPFLRALRIASSFFISFCFGMMKNRYITTNIRTNGRRPMRALPPLAGAWSAKTEIRGLFRSKIQDGTKMYLMRFRAHDGFRHFK